MEGGDGIGRVMVIELVEKCVSGLSGTHFTVLLYIGFYGIRICRYKMRY